ncbi:hypothetical protein [Dokdonella sp.]|uniref:hypothetical protein n=1 Tax=Dokdonella sp. TaxID=2291710 RepID=UPI002F42F917
MKPRSVQRFALVGLCAFGVVRAAAPAPAPKVHTGRDDCAGASVTATYSPRLQFGLDGQAMSPAMFAAEVVRRREGKPLRCVIVVASCRDAALSKQTYQALKPYGVTRISWQPDPTLFPDPTTKMPECTQ